MVLNLNWLPIRPLNPIPVGWFKLKRSICLKISGPDRRSHYLTFKFKISYKYLRLKLFDGYPLDLYTVYLGVDRNWGYN